MRFLLLTGLLTLLSGCDMCRFIGCEVDPPADSSPFEVAIRHLAVWGSIALTAGIIGSVVLVMAGLPKVFARLAGGLAAGGLAAVICAAGLRWFSEHIWLVIIVSVVAFAAYLWFFQRKFVEKYLGDLDGDGKLG